MELSPRQRAILRTVFQLHQGLLMNVKDVDPVLAAWIMERDTIGGAVVPKEKYEEIVALLHSRKKIAAIKIFREITGVGLKEAKEAIDEFERTL
jgi:ribosomal protein L7/L12